MIQSRRQQFFTALYSAPQQIQDVAGSSEMGKVVRKIAKEHNLSEDQKDTVSKEAGLVLVGVTARSDFSEHLQTRAQIENREAREIADQIDGLFFAPVAHILNTYEVNKKDAVTAGGSAEEQKNGKGHPDNLGGPQPSSNNPQHVRSAVNPAELAQEMIHAHGLHIDQAGTVQQLIERVLSGEIRSRAFPEKVEREIGVSTEKAQEIAAGINERVFEPIKRAFVTPPQNETPPEPKEKIRPGEEDTYREPIEASDVNIPEASNPSPEETPETTPSRDDVLKEVEDVENKRPPEEKEGGGEHTSPSEPNPEKTPGGEASQKKGLVRNMFAEEKERRRKAVEKSITRERLSGGFDEENSEQAEEETQKTSSAENVNNDSDSSQERKEENKTPEQQQKRPEESFETKKQEASKDMYREPIQ